jgi:hypothetical protein
MAREAPEQGERQMPVAPIIQPGVRRDPFLPVGKEALVLNDDGRRLDPKSAAEWAEWVSASRTRHFALGDPLLDWLDTYGAARGFKADTMLADYDPRTDFFAFIMAKGAEFETAVMKVLKRQLKMVRIAKTPEETRMLAVAEKTVAAMVAGAEIITQGVLRNPETRTYGAVDALVRSDVLADMFPDDVDYAECRRPAPLLGGAPYHYVVVDIKYHTLDLGRDGGALSDVIPYMLQVWLYSEALGRIQGLVPGASYLLGRNWKQGQADRGKGPLERIARVDARRRVTAASSESVGDTALAAVAWVRRMRLEGKGWKILPKPSVQELYPNMKNGEDNPWRSAKKSIAEQICELTMLPGVSVSTRNFAHGKGLYKWTDPMAATVLTPLVKDQYLKKMLDVLHANHRFSPKR